MASKLPRFFTGRRICIICEGDEEYEYLEKLISLDVWRWNLVLYQRINVPQFHLFFLLKYIYRYLDTR